jgi:hypothetical protein
MIREIKKGQTHRDIWPEQYSDPFVGQTVEVVTTQGSQGKGKVIRVFNTRFGRLAEVEGVGEKEGIAWLRSDCKIEEAR